MIVLIDTRTGNYVNDFQSNATAGVLIENAVKAGLGTESDFEEVDVTEEEFEAIRTQYFIDNPPSPVVDDEE